MWDKLTDVLTNVVYAGVGAAALVVETAGDLGKVLVEKGEAAARQGRQFGEEFQEKAKQAAQERRDQQFQESVDRLTAQQREDLRHHLDDLDELDRQAEEMARAAAEVEAGPEAVSEEHAEDSEKE
ncbi:hypothetical protein [Pseudoflavonifractor sp. MSJ-37]|uniref:hypothetical protein n=1 Tax=Pseudoflavonifractor sp. MSJ-37 TaxID=2841531 RepID=UPI001C10BF47|nr:hypothetical protein [Pseudoflavonifractor sp. MSJ-37]MBU5434832.1 hypothetical protein [Pseudoflavonifractor sp. MSJ-37]